jgi:hypothetical protein
MNKAICLGLLKATASHNEGKKEMKHLLGGENRNDYLTVARTSDNARHETNRHLCYGHAVAAAFRCAKPYKGTQGLLPANTNVLTNI